MLSGTGLCDEPISRPEAPTECVVPECDRASSTMRRHCHTVGFGAIGGGCSGYGPT